MSNLAEINTKLIELPALKARAFENFGMAKIHEDEVRGEIYLANRKGNTIEATKALVEKDERVREAKLTRVRLEAHWLRLRDELATYVELARNERSLMREIEPSI